MVALLFFCSHHLYVRAIDKAYPNITLDLSAPVSEFVRRQIMDEKPYVWKRMRNKFQSQTGRLPGLSRILLLIKHFARKGMHTVAACERWHDACHSAL
jgi:hypothetical protein